MRERLGSLGPLGSVQRLFTRRDDLHRVDQSGHLEQPMEQRIRSHLHPEPAIPSVGRHLGLHEDVQCHRIGKTRFGEIHHDDAALVDELHEDLA